MAKAPQRRAAGSEGPTRLIFHVDMDCFFVSVGIRDRPHLRDKPVGVSHSKGSLEAATAEIGSCLRWRALTGRGGADRDGFRSPFLPLLLPAQHPATTLRGSTASATA